jgi:hypothetical protein
MVCGLLAMKERSKMAGACHAVEAAGAKASPISTQIPSSNAAWVEASWMNASKSILEKL